MHNCKCGTIIGDGEATCGQCVNPLASKVTQLEQELEAVKTDKSRLVAVVHEHRDCLRMLVDGIQDEIDSRPQHKNLGKKGIRSRLIGLVLSTPSVSSVLTPPQPPSKPETNDNSPDAG